MEKLKRVEIIVGNYDLHRAIAIAETAGITGYTIIPDLKGNGERGYRDADGLTEAFKNSLVLIYCDNEIWLKMQEPLRELLVRIGGLVAISDCEILMH